MNQPIKILILSFSVILTSYISYGLFNANTVNFDENNDSKKNINIDCAFCHSNKVKFQFTHAAAQDDCESCHVSNGNKHPQSSVKGFNLAAEMPELCYSCHESKSDKKFIHSQIKKASCNSCHDSHGSNYKSFLSSSTQDNCKKCHASIISKNKLTHAAVEFGTCNNCHDIHQSDNQNQLISAKPQICFSCHGDMEIVMNLPKQHAPAAEDCSNCHNAHQSINTKLLSEKTPALCFNCHNDIQEALTIAKSEHNSLKSEKNCSNCHNPHASKHQRLLSDETNSICLSCHNKEIQNSGLIIRNIQAELSERKFTHAAIISGTCTSCHKAHSSKYKSLLASQYTSDTYSEADVQNYALCFECHDSNLLTAEYTSDATNFRHGTKNMHYLHSSGQKGRTCSVCHDIHAADNKFLVKKRLMFGTWDMPMKFKINENGGSCGNGCHIEKNYNRLDTLIYNFANKDTLKPIINNDNTIVNQTDTTDIIIVENKNIIEKDTLKPIINNDNTIVNQADTTDIIIVENKNIIEKDTLKPIINNDNTIVNQADTTDYSRKISVAEAFKEISSLKILFEYGISELSEHSEAQIQQIAMFLKEYPDAKIEITGYTDSIGSEKSNFELGLKRASYVKDLLIKKGIKSDRIIVKSQGEKNPVSSNNTEKQRAINRRIELNLYK